MLGSADNEGARQAIVKGCSSSEPLANCVDCVTRLEIDLHLAAWWERVPRKRNLGDPFGARAAKKSQAHESKYILEVLSGLSLRGRWKSSVVSCVCRVSCVPRVVCPACRVAFVVSCVVCVVSASVSSVCRFVIVS